jgi:hypothetical protein
MYFVIAQIADCISPAMWNFFEKSLISPLGLIWHYYLKIQCTQQKLILQNRYENNYHIKSLDMHFKDHPVKELFLFKDVELSGYDFKT